MRRREFLKSTLFAGLATPYISRSVWAVEAGKPLPIPPLMDVDDGSGNMIDAISGDHNFADKKTTRTLGYSQNYLGPVLRMKRGQTAKIKVGNKTSSAVTAHWHGMHIPGSVDGGPQLAFGPGESWFPSLDIDQPASTLWYHSHVHGKTADQVYAGLAGMILIEDPDAEESGLPNNYGVDDLPLVVQDKAFDDDANLIYVKRGPSLMHGFRGGEIAVNGAVRPIASVPAGLTRLRLLNASNARIYKFRFEDDRVFHQVASDGGLLPAPIAKKSLVLAPAERIEIVVDFTSAKSVRLLSRPDSNDPMVGSIMGGLVGRIMGDHIPSPDSVNSNDEFVILKFEPDAARLASQSELPKTFPSVQVPDFGKPLRRRLFSLDMHVGGGMMMGGQGMGQMGINNKSMDMSRIDQEVRLGETEIWLVLSNEMAHPFHIHGTSFQVLSHNEKSVAFNEVGLKDVFLVDGQAEFLVQFNKPATVDTPYMYHCHILEHEDAGMMGQFTVS